uniref:Tyr recombinase domain-containing protein n=1 Tax=Amphimedon queenslandica TaxID=400682 RepID=A0A1X7T2P2_AMPQE
MAGINHFSTERLFRAIVKTKEGEKLRTSGSISYTRVREILLEKLRSLGYEPSEFGTHSFRAGGATTAANQGVPDRLFKRHGRWKSETAKDGSSFCVVLMFVVLRARGCGQGFFHLMYKNKKKKKKKKSM